MAYSVDDVKQALNLYGYSLDDKIDEQELKTKQRNLVKQYHPDKFPDPKEKQQAEEKTKKINSSYDILSWWLKEGQDEYKRMRSSSYQGSYNPNYGQTRGGYYGQTQGGNNNVDDILREILRTFFGSSDDDDEYSNTRRTYNSQGGYYRDDYDNNYDDDYTYDYDEYSSRNSSSNRTSSSQRGSYYGSGGSSYNNGGSSYNKSSYNKTYKGSYGNQNKGKKPTGLQIKNIIFFIVEVVFFVILFRSCFS